MERKSGDKGPTTGGPAATGNVEKSPGKGSLGGPKGSLKGTKDDKSGEDNAGRKTQAATSLDRKTQTSIASTSKKSSKGPTGFQRNSKFIVKRPLVRSEDYVSDLKAQKRVQKLLKYMKKSWKIRVDHTQQDTEFIYRTIQFGYSRKPDNWEDLVAQREQRSIETGFFCGFDGTYEPLINLELDTAALVFKNLPPDLKIKGARWDKMMKDREEKKKRPICVKTKPTRWGQYLK